MIRKIVHINEDDCNGCGLCATACHEDAIKMIDGKAKLVSDEYCDGLGDCLPECPTGAITIIEREAEEYNEELVQKTMAEKKLKESSNGNLPFTCPGTAAKSINRINSTKKEIPNTVNTESEINSQLMQWPVQLNLVNTRAPYLNNCDLLIAADCTAYAYGNFHNDFIKNHVTVIGCPKLDDNKYYEEKLSEIFKLNDIKSITVVRMEVPCCGGIINATKNAMLKSETIVPYKEIIISTDGRIL